MEKKEGWRARRRTKRWRREGMSCKLPGAASSPGDHAAASRSRRNDPRIASREFLFILAAKSRPRGQRERQKAIVTPGNLRPDAAYCRIASNGTVATDCI